MVWDLLRTKKEKPAAGKTGYWRTFWRRRWDSNPRTLADQTISSRSRYDHFDTSPYLSQHQHLRKRGELMGRTKKNIQLKIPEKPRKIKGFRSGSYRMATTISSQGRYNHFDISPYCSGDARTGIVYHIFPRIASLFLKKVLQSGILFSVGLRSYGEGEGQTEPCSSSARIRPMKTPIADAIISPLVHPLESPRQCSPRMFVLSRSSILTRLL